MQKKFDITSLPNIAVPAKTPLEMKRVQDLLFSFGYKWVGEDPNGYFYEWDSDVIISIDGVLYNEPDWNGLTHLTLPELEALAAEKRLQSHYTEMGNMPGKDSEAQKRYDAAITYMMNFPNGHRPLVEGYTDKALRIAAGLEPIQPLIK